MTVREEIRRVLTEVIDAVVADQPVTLGVRDAGKSVMLKMNNRRSSKSVLQLVKLMAISNELLATDKKLTKREVYYQHQDIFRTQGEVDRALDRVARTLRVPRDDLRIVAASKGLVFGGSFSMVGPDGKSGPSIILANRVGCRFDGRFILVVEKEAIFQSIISDYDFLKARLGDFLVVTGKGYPCMSTRAFVSHLTRRADAPPAFAIVDFDPYGLEIALQYRLGSTTLPDDSELLACPRLEYLGVSFSDVDAYGKVAPFITHLSERDGKRLKTLKENAMLAGWPDLDAAIHVMGQKGRKAEIEVIDQSNFYFTRNYLLEKLTVKLS